MRFHSKARWIGVLLIPILVFSLIVAVTPPVARSQGGSSERVESDDARVEQSGSWTAQSVSGGSYLYSTGSEADVLTLEFVGTSVEVIYVSGPSLGTLAIEVDGTVLRTVITTAGEVAYAQSSKVSYLSNEPHTLKVYAQEGGIVGVDAFVVTTEAAEAPTASSDNPDRPAGSEVGDPNFIPQRETPNDAAALIGEPQLAELTHVIINEVDPNSVDAVEIFNPTTAAVNITGWVLRIYTNNAEDFTYVFPAFALYPGAYVTVYESAGTNTSTALYANDQTTIEIDFNSAVILQTNLGAGVDFVRWGGSVIVPPAPDAWTGNTNYTFTSSSISLGRNPQNDDDNVSGDWFTQCATLGRPNEQCLRLNEFYHGTTDAVEIHNPTSNSISITGYQFTSYAETNQNDGTYVFPAASIPAGGYIVLYEIAGTNTATRFYANFNFAWNNGDGGGHLTTGSGTSIDYAQWGTTVISPLPTGASFFGGVLPPSSTDDSSMARQQGRADADRTADWCAQPASLGLPNKQSCVVISEIYGGGVDYVEFHNTSLAPYTLTNYTMNAYSDAGAGTLDVSYIFPIFSLPAGGYVRVIEGVGVNTPTLLYIGGASSYDWADSGDSGAVQLFNEGSNGVDFVRFGANTSLGVNGANLLSPNPPLTPNGATNFALGRNTSGADFDYGSDFCAQAQTPSFRNYGCNSRLVLFLPASQFVSLIDSTANPPAPNEYNSYAAGAPAGATGGQWVMGDWDGDGDKTPGVYQTTGASAGVFFTTNDYGPTSNWTQTWFGLFAGVAGNIPVAGRFAGGVNDCLGVMDSQNFPPHGVAFALYFTCVTTGGNPAKTVQWNSILLPDSGGFSGTFQFGTGDFDGNGIDSIACRRGQYITWTNTNPTNVNGEFPNAQFIGAPAGGTSYFVVGDWDNNVLSSFGLFYPATGTFYFRNDLIFNSGVYGTEAVGAPLGPTATAGTWEGY